MNLERLKYLRECKRFTQKEVAMQLNGCSRRNYCYFENGKSEIPQAILIQLSRLYEVSIEYLLNETDDKRFFEQILKENRDLKNEILVLKKRLQQAKEERKDV